MEEECFRRGPQDTEKSFCFRSFLEWRAYKTQSFSASAAARVVPSVCRMSPASAAQAIGAHVLPEKSSFARWSECSLSIIALSCAENPHQETGEAKTTASASSTLGTIVLGAIVLKSSSKVQALPVL